jgi:hypothetical protein
MYTVRCEALMASQRYLALTVRDKSTVKSTIARIESSSDIQEFALSSGSYFDSFQREKVAFLCYHKDPNSATLALLGRFTGNRDERGLEIIEITSI